MKGYSGDSRFYFGDELRLHMRDLIEGASKVNIATAWVSNSDALKLLTSQALRGTAIRIVVGVGGYNTDPVVLKTLGSTAGIELRIYGGVGSPLFHPKLYIFQRQHWQRVLIGSMNFTTAGTTQNIESVLSFDDKPKAAEREFERFWNSPLAVQFNEFNLIGYEAERLLILAEVKNVGATVVLEADVVATADSRVEVDTLRAGWEEYLSELTSIPDEQLQDRRRVLSVRDQLVNRDWSQDLNETELDIMFGIAPYFGFGMLAQAKQNQSQFQGPGNRTRRMQIGDALSSAKVLNQVEPLFVEKVVSRLFDIEYFGPALATRLLVLARPDLFVVVNVKTVEGLRKRFGVEVTGAALNAQTYVELLKKIWAEKWFQSLEPADDSERELWMARVALLDILVYRETSATSI